MSSQTRTNPQSLLDQLPTTVVHGTVLPQISPGNSRSTEIVFRRYRGQLCAEIDRAAAAVQMVYTPFPGEIATAACYVIAESLWENICATYPDMVPSQDKLATVGVVDGRNYLRQTLLKPSHREGVHSYYAAQSRAAEGGARWAVRFVPPEWFEEYLRRRDEQGAARAT